MALEFQRGEIGLRGGEQIERLKPLSQRQLAGFEQGTAEQRRLMTSRRAGSLSNATLGGIPEAPLREHPNQTCPIVNRVPRITIQRKRFLHNQLKDLRSNRTRKVRTYVTRR